MGRAAHRRGHRLQGGGRPPGAAGLGQPDQPAPAAEGAHRRRGRAGRRRPRHGRVPARSHAEPRGQDRRRGRPTRVDQRGAAAHARGLHRAPQARQGARAPPRGARRERRDRLGACRGARVRLAAHRGHADPPHRPGHRARDVQPAPPRAARRTHGPDVVPDPEPPRGARAVRAAQQPAVGDRRARLRVRLQPGGTGDARALGGPVRRLRQLRAGHHRPVPRLRAGQVGTDLAPDAAAPPRLRGLGARALLRAPGALPHARRRGQHARREPDHAGAVLPPAAPPGPHRQAAAARDHDAEVAPAPAAGDEPARCTCPTASSTPCSASRGSTRARSPGSCCAPARSTTTSSGTPTARAARASPSVASSCCTRSPRGRSSS